MTKAYDCALRCLTRREHGAAELKNKLLQKGYSSQESDEALASCQRLHYQSDERYTELVCRTRISQGYGPIRIQQELLSKGIDSALVEQVLSEEDEQVWLERALSVSKKKSKNQVHLSWEEQQKVKRFLVYRGFPASLIARLVVSL